MTLILDGTDITSYLYYESTKPSGGGFDNKSRSVSGSHLSPLSRRGRKGLSYRFPLRFESSGARDTVRSLVAQLVEGDWLVPMEAGYGHRLPANGVSLVPQTWKGPSSARVRDYILSVELEDPLLYDVSEGVSNNWNPTLDTLTSAIENTGDLDAPAVYHCSVTAGWSTYHLADLTLGVYNGAVLEDSLVLADELLDGEVMVLQQVGPKWILSQTYAENFGDGGTKFGHDKYASTSATVTAGALVISASGSATYYFGGVHPVARGAGFTVGFKPTATGAGTVSLEASLDGTIWETVIDSTDGDWTDGEAMSVQVPQAMGRTGVYVRWSCDADVSLSLDDVSVDQLRQVSTSLIPMIGAGDERKIKFYDGATSSNSATITATFRKCVEA
jgi:hypothetical protein